MKRTLRSITFIISFLPIISTAQVTVGSNNPPDPSAVLDLQSTTGGLLYPRLSTAQRNAIANPASGLTIYNLTTNCVQTYFQTSGWQDVVCDCQSFPSSAFTFPNTISQNFASSFTASTSGMNYSWVFQGGSPSTGTNQTESVTWSSAGTYTVTLTVTDNLGCSSTSSQTITVVTCPPLGNNVATFSYTGAMQTWTVPPGVCVVNLKCWGGQGGDGNNGNTGGRGGYAEGELTVAPGQVLNIFVGQAGAGNNGSCVQTTGPRYNGGGAGNCASSGGGASDIRVGGANLTDRVIVAGGGGGCGFYNTNGGNGGGTNGVAGVTHPSSGSTGGGGGTQSAGGTAGTQNGTSGTLGNGGTGGLTYGGGGGGGYYGGGGGGGENGGNGWGGGGGGGSSYTGGVLNATTTPGIRSGNGQVTITY